MSEVVLYKDESGKLAGLGEKGGRAWAKFQALVRSLEIGETLKFSYWAPRSPGMHRRHFVILAQVYEHQDQFVDEHKFRMWVQVGAGFCDLYPGPHGKPVAVPHSIAWDKLDDADFAEHHAAVIGFLRSTHATRFLWPMLDDKAGDDMINTLLREFDV